MTCLATLLSGLALGQEEPQLMLLTEGSPAIPGAAGGPGLHTAPAGLPGVPVPTADPAQLDEPVRWAFREAMEAMEGLSRPGPVTYLGVSAVPLSHDLAAQLPVPEDTGLVVEGIGPDSPAGKAGIQKSDVLLKLDDQILIHPRQLAVLVANRKEGESVKVTLLRKGVEQQVAVVLGKREPATGHAAGFGGGASNDVIFYGGQDAPLRTFVRRFDMGKAGVVGFGGGSGEGGGSGGSGGEGAGGGGGFGGGPGADVRIFKQHYSEVRDANTPPHAEAGGGGEIDAKAELQELRKRLEEVLKHLEEKK